MYRNRQSTTAVNYYNQEINASSPPPPNSIQNDPDDNLKISQQQQLQPKAVNMDDEVQLERAVYQAFASLDPDLALELRTALTLAPALVYRESKFMDFLRTELYDVQAAAVRIANYWKFRRELFEDRWLLPMTQTGAGALTPDQVQLLRSGFKVLLHGENSDPVCMSNYSRLPLGAEYYYDFCPIYFYILSVETCPAAQLQGVCNFYAVTTGFRKVPDLSLDMVKKLGTSLPFKIHKTVVGRMFDYARDSWLNDMACAAVSKNARELGLQPDCVAAPSVRSTIVALEDCGLDRNFIPVDMGGDYFYGQQFNEWVRARLSIEDAMAAAPPVRNTAVTVNHRTTNHTNWNDMMQGFLSEGSSSSSCVVSQDGTSDPRIVELSREDPVTGATHNKVNKKTKKKTKTTLASSSTTSTKERKKMIQQEPGETREEFLKRRDYLYGRRSYYNKERRKNEIQTEFELAKLTNTRLKTEQQRLEVLVQQATCLVHAAEESARTKEDQDVSCHGRLSPGQVTDSSWSEMDPWTD
uniref:Uncharacterized protein n=1 Tax=Amphora coffeiformis TaxID=265554 RepID=A0A7S3LDI9_9STRA